MLEKLLEEIREGKAGPLYLVTGEAVLAEPAAQRLAEALAESVGCEVTTSRRPASLAGPLEDLRTYSLFSPAKVVLAIETALLADRSAAADLMDEVAAVVPVSTDAGGELTPRERQAGSRALQVLHLFGLAPDSAPEAAVGELPAWAFQGGKAHRRRRRSGRGKRQVAELRTQLVQLLERVRDEGLVGWAEGDAADLAAVLNTGLPEGHAMVLAESSVASDHPLLSRLEEAGWLVRVGRVEADRRGGWSGLQELARELEQQTGRSISPPALEEMARRTLRKSQGRGQWDRVDAESTARLAAEYRKLAMLTGDRIELPQVLEAVEDRGQEDVWQLLDAVGAGRAEEALARFRRLLWSAEEPMAARLQLFSLLAEFSRQLVAIQGLVQQHGLATGERSFQRFKKKIAPRLQEAPPEGGESFLARLHPFRLHRVYLAASRLAGSDLSLLPWRTLETELRLKGESGSVDSALAELLLEICRGPASAGRVGA